MDITIKITPNESGQPVGKLADAEIVFGEDTGPLAGLRLVGFSVWSRTGGGRNVTFPARQYSVNGERRSYMLLRGLLPTSTDALKDAIITAYMQHEAGGDRQDHARARARAGRVRQHHHRQRRHRAPTERRQDVLSVASAYVTGRPPGALTLPTTKRG